MSAAPLIGIICGARAEAAALGRLARDPRLMLVFSGARPDRAETGARGCVAAGCRALISFGTAAGLAPGLGAGVLLSPAAVLDTDGRRYPLDPALVPPTGTAGDLAGCDRAVSQPGAKAALHERTGAVAADMESHRLARVAAEAGVPAGAIRAVLDPAGRALPEATLAALGPDGRSRPGVLLRALLARPGDAGALIVLARDFRHARAALARAAVAVLVPALARFATPQA